MKQKKNILALAIVMLLALAMLFAYKAYSPKQAQGQKTISITITHKNGETKNLTIKTDAIYLRAALESENLIEGQETEYGLWLTTVDGETADPTNEEWWGLTVHGEFTNYGVEQQVINDGDIYELTLYAGYENYN